MREAEGLFQFSPLTRACIIVRTSIHSELSSGMCAIDGVCVHAPVPLQ